MPNRLSDAVSPYLRAHAENPVDWHPWSEDAFAEARERDVPVFVSIGYATCHWCHVMARESFSDPQLAARLNAEFVPVKVDREEHPDVDAAYLAAASAFTRNLGWPLSVFATPDGRAFFAGTYFPPDPRGGIPSFGQILDAVTDAWTTRRADVADTAKRVAAAVSELGRSGVTAATLPNPEQIAAAAGSLGSAEDPEYGGFGTPPQFAGPKFPAVPALAFLLASGSPVGEHAAMHTLDRMADSALRDRVDGGFFRYGTRRDWSDPHYERMLYDNAGLLRLYADAVSLAPADSESQAAAGGARRHAEVAGGIGSFLLGTMRVEGGFASAQDSESEVDGVRREGAYYLLDADGRSRQPRPSLDEKVLTAWNGLAIGALAHAGSLLELPEWVAEASAVASGLLEAHVSDGGRMLTRASLAGRPSPAAPALEDYGLFARGLLDVFLATGEPRFALAARELVDATMAPAEHAEDEEARGGTRGPFAVPGGGDPVLAAHGIVADADPSEGAYPGGLSSLADSARVLFALTDDTRYDRAARAAVSSVADLALRSPIAFGGMLQTAVALGVELQQLVVIVPGKQASVGAMERVRHATAARVQSLGPGAVGVAITQGAASELAAAGFGLFEGRTAQNEEPTEYLCHAFTCELPRPFTL
ncbi:thioredoxin domain-containing protein [Rathayibacter sp. KR2-224]|uniref:thioredoxin domain-containing protein n=1 Tax=Rathayibacter sp. KR2-224 TaxID=3400913 RepID=UPI003C10F380